jgi:ankyrin repeat protein
MAFEQAANRCSLKFDHLQPLISKACKFDIIGQLVHFPCRYNNIDFLKWLIDWLRQNNILYTLNERDHAGYTPLLTAVFYRSKECVEYLLQVSMYLQSSASNIYKKKLKI